MHTQVAAHLKVCGSLSVSHSARKLLAQSWGAWRRYTEACIKKEEHAIEICAHRSQHMTLVVWSRAAKKQKRQVPLLCPPSALAAVITARSLQ